MTGFYTWLLNETDVGPFHRAIIKKDPGNVHPVSYDYAWDSDQDKDRDDWLLSVNKTANRYHNNIDVIRHDLYNRIFSKRYFKKSMYGQSFNDLDYFLGLTINNLNHIINYTTTPDTIHKERYPHHQDARWISKSIKPALTSTYEAMIELYSEVEDLIEEYFQPTIILLIKKIKTWIDSIYKKFNESEDELHGHISKNYQLEQIPNLIKQILENIKTLRMFFNNQLPEESTPSEDDLSYAIEQIGKNRYIIEILYDKENFDFKDIKIVNDLYNDVLSNYTFIRDNFDRKTLGKYKEYMGNVAKLMFSLQHGIK